jgi:hypothetical protein
MNNEVLIFLSAEEKASFNKFYAFIKHDASRFSNPEEYDSRSFELHSGYVFDSCLLSRVLRSDHPYSLPAL